MTGRGKAWVMAVAAAGVGTALVSASTRNLTAQALAQVQVQVRQPCLHDDRETTMQHDRRLEAIEAMKMIEDLRVHVAHLGKGAATWEDLERAPMLSWWRNEGGSHGDLARKIRWGQVEPLPGWRIRWMNGRGIQPPVFALTDVRDPCRFMLSSTDPNVVPKPELKIVPLDSTAQ